MIPAAKVFFLLSLFTFLGTHARNLPEDILRISNVDYGLASSIRSITRPAIKSPPPPEVDPPIRPIMSNKIITMPSFIGKTHSPPPAPYIAPPHDQANAYQRWTSIFATRGTRDNEIIKRPHQLSPPPPHLAPPQVEKEIK
ncbi:hypothetical protein POM88_051389 [Heracleum sosnowskyi]|uniref:Uncharacterized protein n=1 Tax=Heracleum sosnowskyi TaxID=360622 RepID=A0AAD8H0J0_9APIA|nr:hypothetical protein POM88_051389 [Heracleum sosnowskyi]